MKGITSGIFIIITQSKSSTIAATIVSRTIPTLV
jgi:hypothetical protein